MKIAQKKNPKEIEKEIKTKIIHSIDTILSKNPSSSEKLKKMIRKAASEIAKKYMKAVKKVEKKTGKIKPVPSEIKAAKKASVKKVSVKKVARKKSANPSVANGNLRANDL